MVTVWSQRKVALSDCASVSTPVYPRFARSLESVPQTFVKS